jgi:hypothetical protein
MKNKQICCKHVFREERDILYILRTKDCFQFLCGGTHEDREPELISLEEVIERDSSLKNILEMKVNHSIERSKKGADWVLKYYDEN